MRPSIPSRLPRLTIGLTLAALVVLALIGSAGAGGKVAKRVVKKTTNPTLGKIVLTDTKSRTLYTLSAERHGRLICTGACVSTWLPLIVSDSVRPQGPVRLGTIARPGGSVQVTFQGRPLYTFRGDRAPGQVNGEGIEDVGTWHAVAIGKAPTATPQPEPVPVPQPVPAPQPQPGPQPGPTPPPFPY